jgi:predicted ATPase/class 3 adenylate cyclase
VKNLIPQFIHERFLAEEEYGEFQAYTMSIDLSGFTPLTDALMQMGNRGAEKLSNILNQVFGPLVEQVYRRGGFIPYFAGDAFVAIFPEEQADTNPLALIDAAQSVRDLFQEREYKFNNFTIGLKIGLAFGQVQWGIVGQPDKAYYFRGPAIDNCNFCQTIARNQQIIIDEALQEQINQKQIKLTSVGQACYRLEDIIKYTYLGEDKKPVLPDMKEAVLNRFLPKSVVQYNQEGEFRTVIAVFLSFDGVDSHQLMNEFASTVLEEIISFSGYFKEIDFGDKGGVMVGFFGAPVSFENNIERALEFIYALRSELRELQFEKGLRFKAGLTVGTAYTGIVGGAERCQYAAVGNRVNLAARLMVYADWGEILVDSEIQKDRHFTFQHKGDIKYKGIKGTVPTFKLIGRNYRIRNVYSGSMIGRDIELQQLMDAAKPLMEGKSAGIAYVYGEAGIGKSRLTHELRKRLKKIGNINWHTCQADQILRKPFNPFTYFLRNYFDQSPDGDADINRAHFEEKYEWLIDQLEGIQYPGIEEIRKEIKRTKSVLGALVGIIYQDSIWLQLDAKGKYQNTLIAIIHLLMAESLIQPMVLELEDGHWVDENSEELLEDFVRHLNRFPILLLVTSRYRDDGSKPQIIDHSLLESFHIPTLEINLNYLQPVAVRRFAETILQGQVSEEFYEVLLKTTNSNPFYLEQILEYFAESEFLEFENGEWNIIDQNIKLSNSIMAVLTARIDRLSSLVKETVKAAAVIGREFEIPILSEVMKGNDFFSNTDLQATDILHEQIHMAEKGQIWHAMNELRYIFRHSLLREAAYSMQLRVRLQQLHRLIAEAIEKLYDSNIQERYVDLAFHYEQAGVFDKTCEYLRKAADYARSNFQNQQALDFYEKLLEKLSTKEDSYTQIQTHLKKGKILELIGQWDQCEEAYAYALKLAKMTRDAMHLGKANNRMGRVLMLKGQYRKSMDYLQTAARLFESIDDKEGISEVYGNIGNLYFRQGAYEEAKAFFAESIELSQKYDFIPVNAQIVSNLGLTHMNQGDYDEGINVQKEQLAFCQKSNDKQGMATIFTFLGVVYLEKGDYDQALESFEKGLELSEELGNKLLMPIAIGNIGIIYERKGDYEQAMEQYQRDLQICEELGDKQGVAIALGLIGQLLNIKGEFYKAIEYLQKDLMISEELGYQKGIAKAVNTLGDVFFLTGNYQRSLHFYDRAIDVTRKIGNKLVLGYSLVEKGAVLLEMKDEKNLLVVCHEALEVATDLGNPDLLFEAQVLQARVNLKSGNREVAVSILKELEANTLSTDQEAAIAFEWFRINPEDEDARAKAKTLYQELYLLTPRYTYKLRLQEL